MEMRLIEPNLTFTPGFQGEDRIRRILGAPQPIERIIRHWCKKNRALTFSRFNDLPADTLAISFDHGRENVGFAFIDARPIIARLPGYEALDESICRYADMDGFRPNDEWCDRRNERLGLSSPADETAMEGSFAAVTEVIVSYALSSAGMAIVRSVAAGAEIGGGLLAAQAGYSVEAIFMGEQPATAEFGWFECLTIPG